MWSQRKKFNQFHPKCVFSGTCDVSKGILSQKEGKIVYKGILIPRKKGKMQGVVTREET